MKQQLFFGTAAALGVSMGLREKSVSLLRGQVSEAQRAALW